EALRPAWRVARERAEAFNATVDALVGGRTRVSDVVAAPNSSDPHRRYAAGKRRGVGVACMWYGIGNTVIANPSSMQVGLRSDGRIVLYNGAVDIGQGTCTILPQICADALGLPLALFDQVTGDTD